MGGTLYLGNPWWLLLLGLVPLLLWAARGRLLHLSPLRRRVIIGLRLLLLTLLALALADLHAVRESDRLSVLFLLDQSDSMSASARTEALDFVQAATANMATDDRAGVIVFGENALVEESPRLNMRLNSLSSTPSTGYTNMADAIRLGLALFPPDSARRLVLISDGRNNLGDARLAAQLAAANNVALSTLPVATTSGAEVRLTELNVPDVVREGETFELEIGIESNIPTTVEIQIFGDGQLLVRKVRDDIFPGENSDHFQMQAGQQGFSTFQARIVPVEDGQAQNNRLDAFSLVEGPLQVLVVAREATAAGNLLAALRSGGLTTQLVAPNEMPSAPIALSQYAAVVLVDVPAFALSPSQLELLQVYVRDLGGGLVAIGGPNSFGAGGYFQTPLEETLPVEMTLRDEERLPGMSMFMVIDKSGSMDSGGLPNGSGPRKVELAKEAINRSVDLLTPLDRVGVVAFDSAAQWVVNPLPASSLNVIKSQVGTIRADGGTDILAGLTAAADKMPDETSIVKHIVLLTDGGANPQGIPELVDELVANEVSLSVVAIGDGYAPFLEDIAAQGNGRFHFAQDASTIPQIFAQETALAARAYIVEEPTVPRLLSSSPVLAGITEAVPQLFGYIATSRKTTARTVLIAPNDDPLLAHWQYGLGRAVAWTSDAQGQWGSDWVNWNEFARFWNQVVRWTIVDSPQSGLEAQLRFDPETGTSRLQVEAIDAQGNYLNNLVLESTLVDPELNQRQVQLTQVAPGLYETDLQVDELGSYLLRVQGSNREGQLVSAATRGFVISYSPEYAADNPDPTLMRDLANIGGGQVLDPGQAAAVFERNLPPASSAMPLWPWLLSLFVILLPVDIALRRLVFGRADLRRLVQRLQQAIAQPAAQPAPAPAASSSSASRLLNVKQDSQTTDNTETGPAPARPDAPAERPARVVIRPEQAQADAPPADSSPTPSEDSNTDDEAGRMGRLLKAKRQARK